MFPSFPLNLTEFREKWTVWTVSRAKELPPSAERMRTTKLSPLRSLNCTKQIALARAWALGKPDHDVRFIRLPVPITERLMPNQDGPACARFGPGPTVPPTQNIGMSNTTSKLPQSAALRRRSISSAADAAGCLIVINRHLCPIDSRRLFWRNGNSHAVRVGGSYNTAECVRENWPGGARGAPL
jgi:hypothetical protein